MRPIPLLLATLVLLAPFALAVDMPRPSLGDFWETRSSVETDEGPVEQTVRSTITAIETIIVEGVSHEAVRSEFFSNQTTSSEGIDFTSSTHSQSWQRVSDGAALRSRTVTTTSSTFVGFPTGETTTETVYLQPCRHIEYPFDVGDSWTSSCSTRTTTTSSFPGSTPTTTTATETNGVRVLRAESVTVPAGRFDTLVLEWNSSTDSNATTYFQWYAPTACGPVRTAIDANGTQLNSELAAFRCANAPTSAPPATTPPATTSPVTTPPGGVPPTGTTPASTPTGTTPAATGNATGDQGAPFAPAWALLAAVGAAALVARRARR